MPGLAKLKCKGKSKLKPTEDAIAYHGPCRTGSLAGIVANHPVEA
jgi:hypothetical protein